MEILSGLLILLALIPPLLIATAVIVKGWEWFIEDHYWGPVDDARTRQPPTEEVDE